MTPTDVKTAARQHQREVLNTIIDLLESLPDQQQRSETILSAAVIVGVKITEKTTPSPVAAALLPNASAAGDILGTSSRYVLAVVEPENQVYNLDEQLPCDH